MNDKQKTEQVKKEPIIPDHVAVGLFRWLVYAVLLTLLLLPYVLQDWRIITLALILGHFAGQLNAIINKK